MHKSVLTNELLESLQIYPEDFVFDATLGSGGHTREIATKLEQSGLLIATDIDPKAIAEAESWVNDYDVPIKLMLDNFSNIKRIVNEYSERSPNAILADLGWRMDQFAEGDKGFSFSKDEPLLMTYGSPEDYLLTANSIVNEWDEADIANVLYGYGEERYSRRIASAIVSSRKEKPISTTYDLVSIVQKAVPCSYLRGKIHPATKTFQALRIAVNDELTILNDFIEDAFEVLEPGGRLAIISFHSLEDRIVKQMFKKFVVNEEGELLNKKPISASAEEQIDNPRARSAKLRTITKNQA